jgi:hypothetical protein
LELPRLLSWRTSFTIAYQQEEVIIGSLGRFYVIATQSLWDLYGPRRALCRVVDLLAKRKQVAPPVFEGHL